MAGADRGCWDDQYKDQQSYKPGYRGLVKAIFIAPAGVEADASNEAITIMIYVFSIFFYVSVYYVPHLGMTPEPFSSRIRISTWMGDSLVVDRVCRVCMVTL